MPSKLELMNRALAEIGEETQISDPDAAQPGRQLRVINALLPGVVDPILRSHPWLCALRRRSLAKIIMPADPDWKFKSAFQLPPTCLRVWTVDTDEEWERGFVEQRDNEGALIAARDAVLASGDGPLKAVLIERPPYEHLDACLFQALALKLAAMIAGPLQADESIAKMKAQEARDALAEAVAVETSEFGNEPPPFDSAWLAAR